MTKIGFHLDESGAFRFGSYLALAVSLSGLLGSLYFSEVVGLVPCLLCWYQRIALYPLVAIIGIGILRQDRDYPAYVLPLSLSGTVLAGYHLLLQSGVIPERLAPCTLGVSCTDIQIAYLGFVTIPLLSFIAFVFISSVMLWLMRQSRRSND